MKFTKLWEKLDYPIFTTIRQDKGYYKVGQIIKIDTPIDFFFAEIVSIRKMSVSEVTFNIAFHDADCTPKEFSDLLHKFYGDNIGGLILLTLMRNTQ